MTEEPKHYPFPDLNAKDARFMQTMYISNKFSMGQLVKLETMLWLKTQVTSGKFSCDLECVEKYAKDFIGILLHLADDIKANDKR